MELTRNAPLVSGRWSYSTNPDRTAGVLGDVRSTMTYQFGYGVGKEDGLREGRAAGIEAGLQQALTDGTDAGIVIGKEQGRDETIQEAREHAASCLRSAFEEAEILFLEARRDFDLAPSKIYMRPSWPFNFEALYLFPEAQYISDAMLSLMGHAAERESESGDAFFKVSFTFMPETNSTSHDLIMADGFEYFYDRRPD